MSIKELDIIWENDDMLVINKPSGMLCVRDESLSEWPIIAHRLDKETSGCLLMAKNLKALRFLMKQFKDRKVDKEYTALVHGWIEPKEGRVRLPLANRGQGNVRQGVRYDGKMADTAWRTVERLTKDGEDLSLLKVRIYTGRTHQIRVHLSHLGYPVFSDSQYLGKAQLRLDGQRLNRQFLHASKIAFSLLDGVRQAIVAELPQNLLDLINLKEDV